MFKYIIQVQIFPDTKLRFTTRSSTSSLFMIVYFAIKLCCYNIFCCNTEPEQE